MNEELARRPSKFVFSSTAPWWKELNEKLEKNRISVQKQSQDKTVPLNYYAAFDEVCHYFTLYIYYYMVAAIVNILVQTFV